MSGGATPHTSVSHTVPRRATDTKYPMPNALSESRSCTNIIQQKSSCKWAALICLVALAWRFLFIFRDFQWLTNYWLFEDYGYSFKIARNIALGVGETFDGVIPTNGYQPLFAWIIAPIYMLARNDLITPVYIALVMLSIFNVATGYLIYLIVLKISRQKLCALAALIYWSLNIAIARNGTIGLETGLSTFMATLLTYFAMCAEWTSIKPLGATAIGVWAGLAFLSRVDAILIFPAITLALISTQEKTLAKVNRILLVSAGAALIITPYLLWNIFTHGHALPESSIVTSGRSNLMDASHLFTDDWQEKINHSLFVLVGMIQGKSTINGWAPSPDIQGQAQVFAFEFCMAGALAITIFTRQNNKNLILFFTLILLIFAYSIFHHGQYERYHLNAVMIWTILSFSCLAQLLRRIPKKFSTPISAMLALVAAAPVVNAAPQLLTTFAQPAGWKSGIDALNKMASDGDVVSGLQTGNLGYLYQKGRAINLDGVVNKEARAAKNQGKMEEYFRANKIRYFADELAWSYLIPTKFIKSTDAANAFIANMRLRYAKPTENFRIFEITDRQYLKFQKPSSSNHATNVASDGAINQYYTQTKSANGYIAFKASGCIDVKYISGPNFGVIEVFENLERVAEFSSYSDLTDQTTRYSIKLGPRERTLFFRPRPKSPSDDVQNGIAMDAALVNQNCPDTVDLDLSHRPPHQTNRLSRSGSDERESDRL